jgi:hypothetical protein
MIGNIYVGVVPINKKNLWIDEIIMTFVIKIIG